MNYITLTLSLAFRIVVTLIFATAAAACFEAASSESAILPLRAQSVAQQAGTLVLLTTGPVQGEAVQDTRSFIGIPYAAPPVGPLRWRPPQPVAAWKTPLDATGPGVACIQPEGSLVRPIEQSEDCLRLNVFTPAELPAKPLPVMVWLHGGGNTTGSANAMIERATFFGPTPGPVRLYDGATFNDFAERDVVVVTLNYRLGALGFLSHPVLTHEEGASGNYGLMDQQAALRWVRDNIAAFGGDPDRVTLFGQSAGATDVCYQMVAQGAQGLFHAAVLQSGSCGSVRLPDLVEAERDGKAFAAELGCADPNPFESLKCMRAKPARDYVRPTLQSEIVSRELRGLAVIDTQILREQPNTALEGGRFEQVPTIVGNDDHDGSYLFGQGNLGTDFNALLGFIDADQPSDAEKLDLSGELTALGRTVTHAAVSDALFICPARTFAARVSKFAPTYLYSFKRSTAFEPASKAFAVEDVVQGVDQLWTWNIWPALSPYTADDTSLSLQMRGYWTQLVEGDVNPKDEPRWARPHWARYDSVHETELVFDLSIESVDGRRSERCDRAK